MLYFIVGGSIRIEKEVNITNQNFWPVDHHLWQLTKEKQKVLFKI